MVRIATTADVEQISTLYRDTITTINAQHYNEEQTTAWAGRWTDTSAWTDKVNTQHFLVAENDGLITGFASITKGGHVDMLFVHKNYQGKGIARDLISRLERFAIERQILLLTTDASITARPIFEHMGFTVVTPQKVVVSGVSLTNYKMKKQLYR